MHGVIVGICVHFPRRAMSTETLNKLLKLSLCVSDNAIRSFLYLKLLKSLHRISTTSCLCCLKETALLFIILYYPLWKLCWSNRILLLSNIIVYYNITTTNYCPFMLNVTTVIELKNQSTFHSFTFTRNVIMQTNNHSYGTITILYSNCGQ